MVSMSKPLVAGVIVAFAAYHAAAEEISTPAPPISTDDEPFLLEKIIRAENEVEWSVQAGDCDEGAAFFQTAFGKEACKLARMNTDSETAIQPNCLPRVHMPPENVQKKGAVLLYHGFTACTRQVMDLANSLSVQGFIVYTPLVIGHGRAYDSGCGENGKLCVNKDYVEELADSPHQYRDFVKQSVEDFKKDALSQMYDVPPTYGVYGLSVGAALATRALTDDAGSFFTHGLISSPFLGASLEAEKFEECQKVEDSEKAWKKCIEDNDSQGFMGESGAESLAKVLSAIGPHPKRALSFGQLNSLYRRLSANALTILTHPFTKFGFSQLAAIESLNTEQGWGGQCEVERSHGRGGYCNYRMKHVMAAHAFAINTIASAPSIKTKHFDAIVVEKDGKILNGIVNDLIKTVAESQTHGGALGAASNNFNALFGFPRFFPEQERPETNICVFPIVDGRGIPHSCLSRAESYGDFPRGADVMWWEETLHNEITGFFSSKPVGGAAKLNDSTEPTSATTCYGVEDVNNATKEYFAVVS